MREPSDWGVLILLLFALEWAWAGAHEEGITNGQQSLPTINRAINAPAAATVIPDYGTAAPETRLYRRTDLNTQAQSRLADCVNKNTPECEAMTGATRSANTPKPAITPYDSSITEAARITQHPASVLGDLSSFYAGCTLTENPQPARTEIKQCQRDLGIGHYSCRRNLVVSTQRSAPNCTEGQWFKQGSVDRNGADHMVAEVQCQLQNNDKQQFRFHAWGNKGACVGRQIVELPSEPSLNAVAVTTLSPHWENYCWKNFQVVMAAGSGCIDTRCSYLFEFGTPIYACPGRTVAGNTLQAFWKGSKTATLGPADQCFALPDADSNGQCPIGASRLDDGTQRCAQLSGNLILSGASGWKIPLIYDRPNFTHTETDTWDDQCPRLEAGGRCQVTLADRCVEGPSTKNIEGVAITRSCWAYERNVACDGETASNECTPLIEKGCQPQNSECRQRNVATGQCEQYLDTYSCPLPAETVTSATDCPANVSCLGTHCFNTASATDQDFAKTMTLMEAVREAGVYLDVDKLEIFKGEADSCRKRLLTNCCDNDTSGAGMTNKKLFGTGSNLVYDVLMNAGNQQFLTQGLKALLANTGLGGSFLSYGVTLAEQGSTLSPALLILNPGSPTLIALNPWALSISIIMYSVMSLTECNVEEAKLALKEGAGLCHTIGTYCSSCIRILGKCVSCIEHLTQKCCFNSKLARLVNEQGRIQVGKTWGTAQSPDCSGFSIAEVQRLDFGAMDLSEFYASIQPKLPNVSDLQQRSREQVNHCYYGKGACP